MLALTLVALGVLSACSVNPAGAADSLANTTSGSGHVSNANPNSSFTFSMVPSSGITACLPKAHGSVTITPGSLNDTMKVSVTGLVPSTGYDLFVIQVPNKPFGVAWYQSDLKTDSTGAGSATVRGIFNKETFSVSTGGTGQFFFSSTLLSSPLLNNFQTSLMICSLADVLVRWFADLLLYSFAYLLVC